MQKLATIINFCTNEKSFLQPLLKELEHFCSTVHIPVCDHFFDGTKEDLDLIEQLSSKHKKTSFFLFPYHPELFPQKDRAHLLHSAARMVGFYFLPKEIEWVLFLDVDEVIDGKRFKKWLQKEKNKNYDFMTLANYWYFRKTTCRAKTFETSPLLVRRKKLNRKLLLHKDEREAIFHLGKGKKARGVLGLDEKPMVHHYSWVRSKKEMLKKVLSWGHKTDRNWKALVEKEFEKEKVNKDFIHGYEYEDVKSFIELGSDSLSCDSEKKPIQVKNQELLYMIKGGFFRKTLAKKLFSHS